MRHKYSKWKEKVERKKELALLRHNSAPHWGFRSSCWGSLHSMTRMWHKLHLRLTELSSERQSGIPTALEQLSCGYNQIFFFNILMSVHRLQFSHSYTQKYSEIPGLSALFDQRGLIRTITVSSILFLQSSTVCFNLVLFTVGFESLYGAKQQP